MVVVIENLMDHVGWNWSDVRLLVAREKIPDGWNGVVTYAVFLILEEYLQRQSRTRDSLAQVLIFINPKLKLPKKISDLSRKIHQKRNKLSNKLCPSFLNTEIKTDKAESQSLGPHCDKIGLQTFYLPQTQTDIKQLTNGVIVELFNFLMKNKLKWSQAALLMKAIYKKSISEQRTRKLWLAAVQKYRKLSKNKCKEALELFMRKDMNELGEVKKPDQPKSPKIGNSAIYAQFYRKTQEVYTLKRKLHNAYLSSSKLQKKLENVISSSQKNKDNLLKLKKKCASTIENLRNCTMQKNIKNANKKLKRRNKKIEELEKDVSIYQYEETKLKNKVQSLQNENAVLEKKIEEQKNEKRKTEKDNSYLKSKNAKLGEKIELLSANKKTISLLEKEKNDLMASNEYLNSCLNEVCSEKKIELKCEGKRHYKQCVSKCYMDLLSLGVSTKKIRDVIKIVLINLVDKELSDEDLIDETFAKRQVHVANLLAKMQVAESLSQHENSTIYFDETTKDGRQFFTIDISNNSESLTSSFVEMPDKTAKTQFELIKENLHELSDILKQPGCDNDNVLYSLVSNIKNTMSDRCITNKSMIEIFQKWRDTILPLLYVNYDEFSQELKDELSNINDFYCGFHLLSNMADAAELGLRQFDADVEASNLGMNKLPQFQNWSKKESGVYRLIRNTCDLLQIRGNAKAGCPQYFNAYLEDRNKHNLLKPFIGNRFNILFKNASAVYSHSSDIKEFLLHFGEENLLLKAVSADINCVEYMGAIKALGLLEKHVTTPVMKVLEDKSIEITSMSVYYNCLVEKLKLWSVNPCQLLDKNFIMYESHKPEKDEVFEKLFKVDIEIDKFCKKSIIYICKEMLKKMERQLKDHISGGKYSDENMSSLTKSQISSVRKTNIGPEHNFGSFKYITSLKPNASVFHTEGLLLYRNNKTSSWLEKKSRAEKEILFKKARALVKKALKKSKEMKKNIVKTKQAHIKSKHQMREKKENKRLEKEKSIIEFVKKNGLCVIEKHVDELVNLKIAKTKKIEIFKMNLRYYKLILKIELENKSLLNYGSLELDSLETNLRSTLCHISESQLKSHCENQSISFGINYCGLHSNKQVEHVVSSTPRESHPHTHNLKLSKYTLPDIGDWIAVAYENGWFPGEVTQHVDINHINVAFMHPSTNPNFFKWPMKSDVKTIHCQFIFSRELCPLPTTGLRFFTFENVKELHSLYTIYKNKYFSNEI